MRTGDPMMVPLNLFFDGVQLIATKKCQCQRLVGWGILPATANLRFKSGPSVSRMPPTGGIAPEKRQPATDNQKPRT
jgi:hypothetical protein